jgi:eukaryotic translation initiation factor 2C
MLHSRDVTNTIQNFETELKNKMDRKCQMANCDVIRVNLGDATTALGQEQNLESKFKSKLTEASSLEADLVVLMLPSFDRYTYPKFKELADKHFGLRSLCLAKPSAIRTLGEKATDPATKYISNIAQKINIKFGGINASVSGTKQYLGNDTLVLGADVIHPSGGALENAPSIACIVGSVDQEAGKFLGSARLQSKDKVDREVSTTNLTSKLRAALTYLQIIDHVQEMVMERIRGWMKGTGSQSVPNNIIYYRDGVSQSLSISSI